MVLLAGALAACGGGADGGGPTSIGDALGLPDEQAFRERERDVQEAIRQCMADEGFDYVPVDPSEMNIELAGPGIRPDAEFRRQYGYGVTTRLDRTGEGDDTDPNAAIREALSDTDREAYDRALHGDLAAGVGGDGEVFIQVGPGGEMSGTEAGTPVEPEDAGCFGKAQSEVGGDDAFNPEIGRQLMEMEERIQSDARMVAALEAWSSCMREAGFEYDSPRDIHGDLFERLQALRGPDDEHGRPTGDEAGLARLQDEELAIAAADDECWAEHLRDVEEEVRAEHEGDFVDELGSEGR